MTARTTIATLLAVFVIALAPPALAGDTESRDVLRDIEETYGFVPGFFRFFDRDDIADVWHAFRLLQLNPSIGMDARTRELISVAVATQGPCRPCVYFHAAAALANGASAEEIREAVGIGAATRRLDALLAEPWVEMDRFTLETNLLLWGDRATIASRGPKSDFCDVVIAWSDLDYVDCD